MLKEIEAVEFDELSSKGVVLVDFFSTTCGPCKMLSFVLNDVEKVLGDKVNILKVDFDKNKDLTAKYDVKGYPTLIVLKDGVEVKRMQGLQQKPAIIKALEAEL
jgi:Thioredoxin domain-containing protein